jgi:hypothetical protein
MIKTFMQVFAGQLLKRARNGKRTQALLPFSMENKVVSNPGGTEPQYVGGVLQQMFQSEEKCLTTATMSV